MKSEVYRLNRKGSRTVPCGTLMRQTTTSVLWSVGEVVDGRRSQLLVHSGSLQLPSHQCRLAGVESTGEVKKT